MTSPLKVAAHHRHGIAERIVRSHYTRFCVDIKAICVHIADELTAVLPICTLNRCTRSARLPLTQASAVLDGTMMRLIKQIVHRLGRAYIDKITRSEARAQSFFGPNERSVELRFLFGCLSEIQPK